MDLEELRRLCALMREEGLEELTVEEGGRRVTLRRAVQAVAPQAPPPPTTGILVRSPVVGTFWLRPAPGEPPFVKVGDVVQPGQVLCIVEAMKVMNEIRAETAGVVEEILAEEGAAVEYGQPLFRLRPI